MVPLLRRCLYPKGLVDNERVDVERRTELEEFLEAASEQIAVDGNDDCMPELLSRPNGNVSAAVRSVDACLSEPYECPSAAVVERLDDI